MINNPVEIFYSYSHKDEILCQELVKQIASLEREGLVTSWHDRLISAGDEWQGQINKHLDSSDIILPLLSSDFISSPYCNDVEVKRAIGRHEAGKARVIPVILRPCHWQIPPFDKFQALPLDAEPITSWSNRDEAFLNITLGIRKTVLELRFPQGFENFNVSENLYLINKSDKVKASQLNSDNVEWIMVFSGRVRSIDVAKARAIVEHLRNLCEDPALTLTKIFDGSIILNFESSWRAFIKFTDLIAAGHLKKEIFGMPIIHLERISAADRDEINRKFARPRDLINNPYSVFLMSAEIDADEARFVKRALSDLGCEIFTCRAIDDKRKRDKAYKSYLRGCDGALFFWHKAEREWVRDQLHMVRTAAQRRRKKPLDTALYIKHSDENEYFFTPEAKILDSREELRGWVSDNNQPRLEE
jgi:hypothetical protein